MKNKIVSAVTTALVVGAASTTFAAANPFSDVPAGHWAYEAVTQLAADGIVEGYGDGTYLGNRNITRYEMAQMVAKAMDKVPAGSADAALLDKLKQEFKDELDNLGVKVDEMWKYRDKVTWHGELRYRYKSSRYEQANKSKDKTNRDWVQFRLLPTAEVNEHWKLKARLTAGYEMDKSASRKNADGTSKGDDKFALTYAYAEGDYDKFTVKVGKQDFYSYVDDGLVMDDFFSGAQIQVGSKIKLLGEAGRWDGTGDDPSNYQGVELSYNDGNKFSVGGSYRHFNSVTLDDKASYNRKGKIQDDADIWSAAIGYNFDKNVKLFYAYAQNPTADDYNRSWTGKLSYKGAQKKAGTWGAYAAYRYIGNNVSFAPTYDVAPSNGKGVDLGLTWSPMDNTLTAISYFKGESLERSNNNDIDILWGRVSFFF